MKRRPPKSPLFPYPPLFRPSPSPPAPCDTGRPPRTAATASRLNASGKVRRFLPPLSTIDTSQALQPIRGARSSGAGPPHRAETFKLSTDPLFAAKVRDIVGLYLAPPDRALV